VDAAGLLALDHRRDGRRDVADAGGRGRARRSPERIAFEEQQARHRLGVQPAMDEGTGQLRSIVGKSGTDRAMILPEREGEVGRPRMREA